MATFNSVFPTFITTCGQLHDLLLSVAYALFITGIIVTVYHQFTHETVLRLMIRIILLTCLLVYLPVWGNALQQLLQDSIIAGLGVDPAQIYQQFLELLIINRDPSTSSSWWNILSQLHNISTDLIVTVVLWLLGHFASLMMFWGYIFQQVVLNMGYALSPLLIGFMAIPALKQPGGRYLLNMAGVLLWPLGWAVAALVTQGMLDFISNPSLEYMDPTSQLPDLQKTFGAAAIGFWIIFSTIAAPAIIQKVIASGALAATELFSAGASTAMQTAASAVSGAVAAAPLGPVASVAIGGAAGAASMLSTSANIGNASSLVTGLAQLGFSRSDPSGDRAVRQLLTQLLQHLGQLPPIAPANGLPPKL
jgi:hypothetical protein